MYHIDDELSADARPMRRSCVGRVSVKCRSCVGRQLTDVTYMTHDPNTLQVLTTIVWMPRWLQKDMVIWQKSKSKFQGTRCFAVDALCRFRQLRRNERTTPMRVKRHKTAGDDVDRLCLLRSLQCADSGRVRTRRRRQTLRHSLPKGLTTEIPRSTLKHRCGALCS